MDSHVNHMGAIIFGIAKEHDIFQIWLNPNSTQTIASKNSCDELVCHEHLHLRQTYDFVRASI